MNRGLNFDRGNNFGRTNFDMGLNFGRNDFGRGETHFGWVILDPGVR